MYFRLIVRNIRRNLLRTTLTSMAIVVLVFVVTLVWSVLYFLDLITGEKTSKLKAIVSERWQMPSQMPYAYAATLSKGAAKNPGDVWPQDFMIWQIYAGTLDSDKRTRENLVLVVAMDPRKVNTMLDGPDNLPADQARDLEESIRKMTENRQGVIIGLDRLKAINKRVGERFKLFGLNYKEIDLELDVVGTFPDSVYNQSAVMNAEYLNDALDVYPKTHVNKKHPLAEKSLNYVWLSVPDSESFERLAEQVSSSPDYTTPAVKCETDSSGYSSFLEGYRDLIWGMRWLFSPVILITMALVIANAIGISVRERRTEMAVLKVLGFQPRQVLILVLGEAVFIGTFAGLLSAGITYVVINHVLGGLSFAIAFFPKFYIPGNAVVWGLGMGALTSLAGSLIPAWSARTIKVSEVFAKIA